MSTHVGSIIQKFREGQGIPRSEIYPDLVSDTTYYRFETDKTSIRSRFFIDILQRMGVSFVEFWQEYFAVDEVLQQRLPLLQRAFEASRDMNAEKFYAVAEDFKKLYEENRFFEFKHNYLLCMIYGDDIENCTITFSRKYVQEILDIVRNSELWDVQTRSLLAAMIPYSDWEQIYLMVPLMVEHLESELKRPAPDFQEVTTGYVFASMTKRALQLKDIENFLFMETYLDRLNITKEGMSVRLSRQIFRMIREHVHSGDDEILKEIDRIITSLETLDMQKLITYTKEIRDDYLAWIAAQKKK